MGLLVDIIRRSRSLEPSTRMAYVQCVGRFEAFAPDPAAWNAGNVERWIEALLHRGIAPQTANKHLYALRYATRRMEALGQGHDFARAVESVKTHSKTKRRALAHEEVSRILDTTAPNTPRDMRDRAILVLLVRTGLRVSGLVGITRADIQAPRLIVTLKGGHKHLIYLDEESIIAVGMWLATLGRHTGPVFVSIREPLDGGIVFGKRPLTRKSVNEMITARAKAAGIRRAVHPHLFRHTFITWALENGVPPQRVMAMTAHRSLSAFSGYITDLEAESDPVGSYLPPLLKR